MSVFVWMGWLDTTYLYSLWMKAVWTTLGCWAAAAAPTAGALLPFVVGSESPLAACALALLLLLRSVTGLLSDGGPMGGGADGVTSIGSLAVDDSDSDEEEGRMGMFLWMLEAKWSGVRKSVVAAMCSGVGRVRRLCSARSGGEVQLLLCRLGGNWRWRWRVGW
jgi:hypothetical protein